MDFKIVAISLVQPLTICWRKTDSQQASAVSVETLAAEIHQRGTVADLKPRLHDLAETLGQTYKPAQRQLGLFDAIPVLGKTATARSTWTVIDYDHGQKTLWVMAHADFMTSVHRQDQLLSQQSAVAAASQARGYVGWQRLRNPKIVVVGVTGLAGAIAWYLLH